MLTAFGTLLAFHLRFFAFLTPCDRLLNQLWAELDGFWILFLYILVEKCWRGPHCFFPPHRSGLRVDAMHFVFRVDVVRFGFRMDVIRLGFRVDVILLGFRVNAVHMQNALMRSTPASFISLTSLVSQISLGY